jgi:hypothetical protein
MFNYSSKDIDLANTSVPWHGSDSESSYKKNLKERPSILELHDWIGKSFNYSFNSNGFRCDEFTSDPTVMCLGGSTTLGAGLPIENVWTELVAKELNMKCANLGQGGGSFDTAFRFCVGYIDKIKPKIVIFLQPPSIRWELVSDNNIYHLGNWLLRLEKFPFTEYMKEYMIDENNNYFNTYKNLLAIELLCNQRQIKFLTFEKFGHVKDDLARDLKHPGIRTNLQFANTVISKL